MELSKIRYYEDKGLVQPSRSRKGYRLYSERDVACLREAIRLAQEEFVPLRVVRLRLIEQGLLDPPSTTTNAAPRGARGERRRDQRPRARTDAAPGARAWWSRRVVDDGRTGAGQGVLLRRPSSSPRPGSSPEEFNQIHALGLVRQRSR